MSLICHLRLERGVCEIARDGDVWTLCAKQHVVFFLSYWSAVKCCGFFNSCRKRQLVGVYQEKRNIWRVHECPIVASRRPTKLQFGLRVVGVLMAQNYERVDVASLSRYWLFARIPCIGENGNCRITWDRDGRSSCWSSRHKAHCQKSVPRGAVRARRLSVKSILLLQNGVILSADGAIFDCTLIWTLHQKLIGNILWCDETGQGPRPTRSHEEVHVQRRSR